MDAIAPDIWVESCTGIGLKIPGTSDHAAIIVAHNQTKMRGLVIFDGDAVVTTDNGFGLLPGKRARWQQRGRRHDEHFKK